MRILTISKRVFKEFFRDKRTLAMMFVAPIFIMWLISIVFSANTNSEITVASVNTPQSVVSVMKDIDSVHLEEYQSKEAAEEKLKNNEIDTVISYDNNTYTVTHANIDSTKTMQAQQVLKSSIKASEAKNLVEIVKKVNPKLGENKQEPEVKEYYNYGNADSTFFNKVAPTLIGYILFFFVYFFF